MNNENPLAIAAALAGVATVHLGEPGARSRFPSAGSDGEAPSDLADATASEEASTQDVWRRILFSATPTIS